MLDSTSNINPIKVMCSTCYNLPSHSSNTTMHSDIITQQKNLFSIFFFNITELILHLFFVYINLIVNLFSKLIVCKIEINFSIGKLLKGKFVANTFHFKLFK